MKCSMTADLATKQPCRVATTANISSLSGLFPIDGISVDPGDRILVRHQSNPVENGIYEAASGAWARASDADASGDLVGGTQVLVTSGDLGAGIAWRVAGDGMIAIGTDPIVLSPAFAGDSVTLRYDLNQSVARTVQDKARETVSVKDSGAVGDGVTDDSAAFAAALGSSATEIRVPRGTYRVADVQLVTGKSLVGAGTGQTVLRVVDGSTANILQGVAAHSIIVRDLTLNGDSGTGSSSGIFLSGCYDALIVDVTAANTPGHGIWLYACPRARVDRILIDTANSWALHVQGNNSVFSTYSNINMVNCANRGAMVRDCTHVTLSNISGSSNRGTTMWFQNTSWCLASNIIEYDSLVGDTAVIEGLSVGTWIMGVTAKNCGGHGASIASNSLFGAPRDCHIVNGYFEDQGECLACISDQGTGFKPTLCSIRNVHGKNSGMGNGGPPVPSEAFAISNATQCVISGSVSDTAGNMPYAVTEQHGIGESNNNRFEIDAWVEGTSGYFQVASPSSTIMFPRLERGHERKGDVSYTWNPATDRRQIIYDQAPLTADRDLLLGLSWPGDRVRISRLAGGAFTLRVKQGSVERKALAGTGDWVELYCDGVNWTPVAGS